MKKKLITGLILTSIAIITMGFFDLFSSKQTPYKKYVTEDSFKKNKDNQVKMTPKTLKQLRDLGVFETKELKLEYFFYTNSLDKAKSLTNEIQKLNYTVEYSKSVGDKKIFVITGWTNKMTMSDLKVIAWTKQMCDLGFRFDCDFDGWGTNPDQK
jgi:regulator of RNase E activity RraB